MRLGRTIVSVAAAIAAVSGLAACTKPLPNVTVLSGASTVVLSPQTYCFDATHCHFPKSGESVVHAAAGSTLLVDVPREIADHAWSITSGTLAGNALKSFVGDNYSTGTIANTHSARVDVPYGVGTYTLAVRSATGTWVAEVSVHR
jgi:hypothetical protein